MLTNIQRIRVYSLSIIVAVLILAIFFGYSSWKNVSDIRTLSEAREFSYALEEYRQNFWRYPVGNHIDIRKGVILSENGFTPGSQVFYTGGVPSKSAVTYQGTATSYVISFTLRKTWPEQGLTSTKCRISEHYILSCAK